MADYYTHPEYTPGPSDEDHGGPFDRYYDDEPEPTLPKFCDECGLDTHVTLTTHPIYASFGSFCSQACADVAERRLSAHLQRQTKAS